MYLMLRANGFFASLVHEAPTGLAAFVVAELFYKFHSFTLECLAFMATWFVFSWVASRAGALFRNKDKGISHE